MTKDALLKEARLKLIGYVDYFEGTYDSNPDFVIKPVNNLIARIDAALAAPEPSSMETVRQIRGGCIPGHTLSKGYFYLTDSQAAALIDGLRREGGICDWSEDEEGNWKSDCGAYWVFSNSGGPVENRMKYCYRCGKPITAHGYTIKGE